MRICLVFIPRLNTQAPFLRALPKTRGQHLHSLDNMMQTSLLLIISPSAGSCSQYLDEDDIDEVDILINTIHRRGSTAAVLANCVICCEGASNAAQSLS